MNAYRCTQKRTSSTSQNLELQVEHDEVHICNMIAKMVTALFFVPGRRISECMSDDDVAGRILRTTGYGHENKTGEWNVTDAGGFPCVKGSAPWRLPPKLASH